MRPEKHTLSATAAIAAALALSASPLAAQDAAPATVPAPTMQAQPATPPAPSPAPTIEIPDVTAAPAVSGAGTETTVEAPDASPVAETATPEPTAKPAAKPASRTATTRTTTVSRTAAPVAAAPVAAVPPPADDLGAFPTDNAKAEPVPPAPAAAPTPTQSNDAVGMLGVVLLALLALAILAAGLLYFRRRHPTIAESEPEALEPPADEPVVAATTVEPTPAYTPMASGAFRRRDVAPVAGALPSDGASVDLPARPPESYEARSALLEKMVAAAPDKANPFTDRKQRLHRARLILQSLGTTFDREPRIDLSQYPNNWPELARQYHKAA